MESTIILFVPLCVEGEVDIPAVRGLLDILAMNLQTYPGVQVKAPLFVVDSIDDKLESLERKIMLWSTSYKDEDLMELVQQCGNDIEGVLIPMVTKTGRKKFHLQIKILNCMGNYQVYDEEWEGSLLKITREMHKSTSSIARAMRIKGKGHEKWPFTSDKKALKLFLQGVSLAATFQAGIDQSDCQLIIDTLLESFMLDSGLDLAVYRLLGLLENLLGNPNLPVDNCKSALKALGKLEQLEGLPGPAHILIAEICAGLKRWRKAENNFKKALQKEPENGEMVVALGNFYESRQQWKKAKQVYQRYLQAQPHNPSYLVTHNLGAIFAESGQLKEAVELWCRSLSAQPDYGSAYGNLMNAYMELGQYGKMWVVFEEGLKHTPVAWFSYDHFIRNLDSIADYQETIRLLRQYVDFNPQEQGGYYHLGLALYHRGNEKESRQVLTDSLEFCHEGRFGDAINRLLLMLKIDKFEEKFECACDNVMHGKAKESIAFLQKCNSSVSRFWQGWFLLGKAHHRLAQYPLALKALEHAHQLVPGHSEVLNELGVLATLMNNHGYAKECFSKAVNLKPFHLDYYSNLALSLIKEGEYDRAKEITSRALTINPHDRVARNILELLQNPIVLNKDTIFANMARIKSKKRKRRKKAKRNRKIDRGE